MTKATTTTTREAKTRAGNKLARLLALHIMEASTEKTRTTLLNGVTFEDIERAAVRFAKDQEVGAFNIVDESEALIVLDYYEDGRFSVITTRGELGQIQGQHDLKTLFI